MALKAMLEDEWDYSDKVNESEGCKVIDLSEEDLRDSLRSWSGSERSTSHLFINEYVYLRAEIPRTCALPRRWAVGRFDSR